MPWNNTEEVTLLVVPVTEADDEAAAAELVEDTDAEDSVAENATLGGAEVEVEMEAVEEAEADSDEDEDELLYSSFEIPN